MSEKKDICDCVEKIKERERKAAEKVRQLKELKEKGQFKRVLVPWETFVAMQRDKVNFHGRFVPREG